MYSTVSYMIGIICHNFLWHSPDEGAVRALKELRLTAGDFEVKGIIGRGHFGEVGKTLHFTLIFPGHGIQCACVTASP